MSDIFDWDDEEEEKKADAEVWGAYPLAQPPATPDPPPPHPHEQTALVPTRKSESDTESWDPWNEIDTVIRPRSEPEPRYEAQPQPQYGQPPEPQPQAQYHQPIEPQPAPQYQQTYERQAQPQIIQPIEPQPAPQYQQTYERQAQPQIMQPYEPQPETWSEYRNEQPAQPGVWSEYPADAPEETAQKSGLAMSAGIVFFSSVAFMLFLGWIFDYLFASSPWGLIGGILLGSIVGFVQFFRISSRIFDPKKAAIAERPLMPPDEQHQ